MDKKEPLETTIQKDPEKVLIDKILLNPIELYQKYGYLIHLI